MIQPMHLTGRFTAFPPAVVALLILNGLLFAAQSAGWGAYLTWFFALWPANLPEVAQTTTGQLAAVPQFRVWQLLSYGFLHGGLAHIGFNLFALWMFGTQIENLWGSARFLVYFLTCVIGAGVIQLIVVSSHVPPQLIPTIGASGGVFGILLAFGMMFPERRIVLLIPPVPIKAKWFVIIYGVLELIFGVTGAMSGVAHFAHLGGMLFGLMLILYWRSQVRRRRQQQS